MNSTIDLSKLSPAQLIALQKAAEAMVTEDQKYYLYQMENVHKARTNAKTLVEKQINLEKLRNTQIEIADLPRGFEIMEFRGRKISHKINERAYFSRNHHEEYYEKYRTLPYDKVKDIDLTKYCEVYQETVEASEIVPIKLIVLSKSLRESQEGFRVYGITPINVNTENRPVFEYSIREFLFRMDMQDRVLVHNGSDLKDQDRGKKTLANVRTAFTKLEEKWEIYQEKNYNELYDRKLKQLQEEFVTKFNSREGNIFQIQDREKLDRSYRTTYRYLELHTVSGIKIADLAWIRNQDRDYKNFPTEVNIKIHTIQNQNVFDQNILLEDAILRIKDSVIEAENHYKAYKASIQAVAQVITLV